MKISYVLYSLLVLLLLAIGVFYIFSESWAENKIREKINKVSHLTYDSIDVAIGKRKVTFKGVTFKNAEVNAQAQTIAIEGINIYPLLFTDELKVDRILISNAEVDLRIPQKESKPAKKKLPDFFIKALQLSDCQLSVTRANQSYPFVTSEINLLVEEIGKDEFERPTIIIDKVKKAELKNLSYLTIDSLYVAKSKAIQFKSETNHLGFDSVSVVCTYDKYKLGHVVGHEVDWMNFSIRSGRLNLEGLRELLLNFSIKSIKLNEPILTVFRDKRLPFPDNHRPKLLQEILANDSNSFKVDSILIANADITYEEFVKEAKGPGRVSFNGLNGHISNLYTYNNKAKVAPRLIASCDLLNKSKLYADISFPLSIDGKTVVKGKLNPIDLTAFNDMIRYVAFTKIREGQLKKLDFNFSYDQKTSNGNMNFAYDNLKIAFLNKQQSEPEGVMNGIKSFVANTFVVDSNNDYDSGKFRVGEIAFERNMEKSMFNFWWNSILTGFRSSTGVNASGEKIDVD